MFVHTASVPEDVRIHESISKGSNNNAYRATLAGEHDVVFRAPRRRSDTQQRGSAYWEHRCMTRAAELGVHPRVHRAWIARHGRHEWPSGLYVLSDRYDHDLDDVLYDEGLREEYGLADEADGEEAEGEEEEAEGEEEESESEESESEESEEGGDEAVGQGILRCLATLAADSMFLFDLKASNIVLRKEEDERIDVRILDFGSDFCEWHDPPPPPDGTPPDLPRTRAIDGLRASLLARGCAEDVDALCAHVLLATMLVITSATITFNLRHGRNEHRMDHARRVRAHPLLRITRDYLASMRGENVRLVKQMLRDDAVRGVLRHYHGRRNSGTRRTLELATDARAC